MFNYSPRIEHFFIPALLSAIGEGVRHTTWTTLGWVLYGLAGVACVMIIAALWFEIKRENFYSSPAGPGQLDEWPRDVDATTMISDTVDGQISNYHLPADDQQLAALARGLLVDGAPFSERRWTGRGKPFSDVGFEKLRGEMIRRGLAYWKNGKDKRQGSDLTVAGRRVLAKRLPSPTQKVLVPESSDMSHARTPTRTEGAAD